MRGRPSTDMPRTRPVSVSSVLLGVGTDALVDAFVGKLVGGCTGELSGVGPRSTGVGREFNLPDAAGVAAGSISGEGLATEVGEGTGKRVAD